MRPWRSRTTCRKLGLNVEPSVSLSHAVPWDVLRCDHRPADDLGEHLGDRARSVLAQSRYDPQRWARERRTRNVLPTAVIVSSTVRKNDTLRARGVVAGPRAGEGLGDKARGQQRAGPAAQRDRDREGLCTEATDVLPVRVTRARCEGQRRHGHRPGERVKREHRLRRVPSGRENNPEVPVVVRQAILLMKGPGLAPRERRRRVCGACRRRGCQTDRCAATKYGQGDQRCQGRAPR